MKRSSDLLKETIWVEYRAPSPSAPRILEGDVIVMRGKFTGLVSYTAVLGQTIQLPRVIACEIKMAPSPVWVSVPHPCP